MIGSREKRSNRTLDLFAFAHFAYSARIVESLPVRAISSYREDSAGASFAWQSRPPGEAIGSAREFGAITNRPVLMRAGIVGRM